MNAEISTSRLYTLKDHGGGSYHHTDQTSNPSNLAKEKEE